MKRIIKELDNLLKPYLSNGQKLVSYEFSNLLPSGENYGSVMLQVQMKILNKDNEEKILDCVGKTVPPAQALWELFNTKVTFKKEIAIYKVIKPELNKYGIENGIDCLAGFLAECLGARISLNGNSDSVDEDAVLLLENLKVQGYKVCDRFEGFDEDTAKLLLTDLAVMHAAVIGYKQTNPEDFKTKIRPYLNKDYMFDTTDELVQNFGTAIKNACKDNPKCIPHLSKIDKALREMNYFNRNPPEGKEIFRTLVHNDFWVNNTLVKFEEGKPVNNKIVDFQVIEYCSLANDVIFFLYGSVTMSVLKSKVDELIQFYYDQFIQTLTRLNCDVSVYSFEYLMEEFAVIAKDAQFSHLLYMLVPILGVKAKDLSEFDLAEMFSDKAILHESYPERMQFILLDFARRNWI